MMNWQVAHNGKAVSLEALPVFSAEEFRQEVLAGVAKALRPVLFFGMREERTVRVVAVLADDAQSRLFLASTRMAEGASYASLTPEVPAFHMFERELWEDVGLVPEGHPWLKPVRYDAKGTARHARMEEYPFLHAGGEGGHEVAVGPIHAGVIEPGHFRFLCHGEDVDHLEIQLGYQHRGVERMLVAAPNTHARLRIVESIAGDSVVAHALAFARAMEGLTGAEPPLRAQRIRGMALELERAAVHIGDLAALSGDVAFLLGQSVFGATRTLVINTSLAICGSRFGRGFVRVGGVGADISRQMIPEIRTTLEKVLHDVALTAGALFSSPSVLARFECTGVVSHRQALELGLVGFPARASGVSLDVRADHPFSIFRHVPVHKFTLTSGDVFARAFIRSLEIEQSLRFVLSELEALGDDRALEREGGAPAASSLVISLTEGWRGETVHAIVTDADGAIVRYKVKDPSFHNWFALAQAVRSNGISDFPLCNKSFNLSYCGHDL